MSANYYPGTDPTTPNLLLSLWGMDEIVAQNFILIDTAFGALSSSISVNGTPVSNPNFVDSATATFSVSGSNVSISAAGGSGSVTSFSSGGLSPLFTTAVVTPTTTPALSFSLSTQSANLVFAGPASGSAVGPTFRSLVLADLPSSYPWSSLGNAGGNLTLANGANTTTFQQTSNVAWLWQNTATGTALTTNASPLLELGANYYTGSTSAVDTWSLGSSLAVGANGISTLTVAHSGSTGAPQISLPTPLSFGVSSPQIIGPSGASVGVSIGGNAGLPFVVATTGASSDIMRGYQGGTFQGSITSQSTSGSFGLYSQPTAGTAELGNVGSPSATHVNPLVSLGHGGTTWATTGAGPYVGVNIGATVALGGSNSLHLNWAPTAGAGNFYALQIAPTVNQTSSASGSYTGLRIAVTETALLGTANKLIDLYAGSAGTTEMFSIDNKGALYLGSAASAPTSAGTAGTAGQIVYFSGLLYFCSVSGVAGSATWNKLSMTAV